MVQPDPISAVATAVQSRLQQYFPASKWGFAHTPAVLSVQEFRQHTRRTPMLALAIRTLAPPANTGRTFAANVDMTLVVVVRHQHGGTDTRFFGDNSGAGLYPAWSAAIAALHGWTCPNLGSFFVTKTDQSYADGWDDMGIAIASIDVTTHIKFGDILGATAAAPDFLRMLSDFAPPQEGDHE